MGYIAWGLLWTCCFPSFIFTSFNGALAPLEDLHERERWRKTRVGSIINEFKVYLTIFAPAKEVREGSVIYFSTVSYKRKHNVWVWNAVLLARRQELQNDLFYWKKFDSFFFNFKTERKALSSFFPAKQINTFQSVGILKEYKKSMKQSSAPGRSSVCVTELSPRKPQQEQIKATAFLPTDNKVLTYNKQKVEYAQWYLQTCPSSSDGDRWSFINSLGLRKSQVHDWQVQWACRGEGWGSVCVCGGGGHVWSVHGHAFSPVRYAFTFYNVPSKTFDPSIFFCFRIFLESTLKMKKKREDEYTCQQYNIFSVTVCGDGNNLPTLFPASCFTSWFHITVP